MLVAAYVPRAYRSISHVRGCPSMRVYALKRSRCMISENTIPYHRVSIYKYPICQSLLSPKDTKSEGSKIFLVDGFFTVDKIYTGRIIVIIFGSPIYGSYIYGKYLMFILYYLLIGLTIMFLLDMHLAAFRKKMEEELDVKIEYDTFTRVFIIILWPAAVYIVIKNLL